MSTEIVLADATVSEGNTGPIIDPVILAAVTVDGTEYEIGRDMRLYVRTKGLVEATVPAVPTGLPMPEVFGIDVDKIPDLWTMRRLFDYFFNKYNREVLMIYGKNRTDDKWTFVVPVQEGSPCLVEWEDEKAIEQLAAKSKWVGTIHVHPGNSAAPSGTDIDTWKKPENSGIHLIFGRDGSYTITVSVKGYVFDWSKGQLPEREEVPETVTVEYETSENKELVDLLQLPKPKYTSYQGTSSGYRPYHGVTSNSEYYNRDECIPHWSKKNFTKRQRRFLKKAGFKWNYTDSWWLNNKRAHEMIDNAGQAIYTKEDAASEAVLDLQEAVDYCRTQTGDDYDLMREEYNDRVYKGSDAFAEGVEEDKQWEEHALWQADSELLESLEWAAASTNGYFGGPTDKPIVIKWGEGIVVIPGDEFGAFMQQMADQGYKDRDFKMRRLDDMVSQTLMVSGGGFNG